jgi:hypothetical protein
MKKLIALLLVPTLSFGQTELEGNYISPRVSGGMPPYLYSLDGVIYQASDTFKCLSPGNYTYYVKDDAGAALSNTCILYGVVQISASSIGRTSVTVVGTLGKSPYQYKNGATGTYRSSGTFTNLQRRRTYTFYVKDVLGYTNSITITTL